MERKIGTIIEELSQNNKPENLHMVAKELLSLQKYIVNLNKKHKKRISKISLTLGSPKAESKVSLPEKPRKGKKKKKKESEENEGGAKDKQLPLKVSEVKKMSKKK